MTPAARRCIERVCAQLADRHELLVVSDHAHDGLPDRAQLLITGAHTDTSPAEKRDFAIPHAQGRICAFLDDDAWPADEHWIESALKRFEDPTVDALGGPGVTPPGSPLRERLGGAFYESPLGSGSLRHRFVAQSPVRDIDDWPAYNFFVRTDALRDVGGWATRFYGGEDTKLCLSLVESGHRIVYDPEVVVEHQRRPVFRAHMRQLGNVGRHRGWFVRRFPRTSASPIYFAPSAVVVAAPLLALWASRDGRRFWTSTATLSIAWAAVSASAMRDGRDRATAALLPAALAAGHAAYGAAFLRGLLLTRDIEAM